MKRPLMTVAGGFVLGEVLALCGWASRENGILCVLIAFILSFVLYQYFGRNRVWKVPLTCVRRKVWLFLPIALLLGIVRGGYITPEIPGDQLGKYQTIKGEVYWLDEKNSSYLIYLKNVSYVPQNSESLNSEPLNSHIILYLDEVPDVKLGNIIMADGTLESFPGARNPGQFDSEIYYRTLKITGRIFSPKWELISHKKDHYRQWLFSIRQKLLGILKQVGNEQDFSIFAAILLGDKSSLDIQLKELYQRNGIAHLLAISGLHISLLGMGVYRLLRNAGRSYGFCFIICSWLMVSYGIMTGSSSSASRALIMFCLHLLSEVPGRTYDMNTAISVAAALIFWDNPLLLLSSGVQLSFGAVLGISLVSPVLMDYVNTENKICQSLLVSISLQIVTLPICIYHYFEYPRYALVINFFVIPLMSFVIYSGTFGILFGFISITLGSFSMGAGHYILEFYTLVCEIFEHLPYAMEIVGRPALWQVFVYYGLVMILLVIGSFLPGEEKKHPDGDTWMDIQPTKRKRNPVIFIFVCTVFVYTGLVGVLYPIESKAMEITVLDVGQGDGIFIKVPQGGTYLIDGGSLDVKEMGKYRLTPFLKYHGISSIDYVIVTHGDSDHLSGLLELIENQKSFGIEIKNLIVSKFMEESEEGENLILKASEMGISIIFMEAGNGMKDGDMVLTCIYPASDYRPPSDNDSSLVFTLEYQGFRGLFTGDLESLGEKWILEHTQLSAYDLLKAGHHGSKTSSSQAFIDAVQPKVSVISCGIDNRFGHPHMEVIERLEAIGSRIFQTPESGAVTIKVFDGYWEVGEFLEK